VIFFPSTPLGSHNAFLDLGSNFRREREDMVRETRAAANAAAASIPAAASIATPTPPEKRDGSAGSGGKRGGFAARPRVNIALNNES
jgi:hypothetical protein